MTVRRGLQLVGCAWAELSWHHLAYALLVGGLFLCSNLGFFAHYDASTTNLAGFVARHVVVGCLLVLAISAADRLVDEGASMLLTYGAAVVIVAVISDPLAQSVTHLWTMSGVTSSSLAPNLTGLVGVSIKAGLGTAAYVRWRDARLSAEALKRSQFERSEESRRLTETRLQTLQARVDPALLFDALKTVAERQRTDPASADALLDELTMLLRALMPGEAGRSTTVEREFELAALYFRVSTASRGALTFDMSIATDVRAVRLPPMLLIPLLREVLIGCPGRPAHMRLSAEASPDGLALRLSVTPSIGEAILASAELVQLRLRLQELFGETGRLHVDAGEPFEARIIVPRPSG